MKTLTYLIFLATLCFPSAHLSIAANLNRTLGDYVVSIAVLLLVFVIFASPYVIGGDMQLDNASIEELCQEVVVPRFVAEATGKGQGVKLVQKRTSCRIN